MDAIKPLALDDFAGQVGASFTVPAGELQLALVLDAAVSLSESGRPGGSFRLDFIGPAQPILPQGIYRFAVSNVDHDIFVVPISSNPEGTRYEAIFN